MAATLAGMPFLSRRKSTMRYCRLCPPPRCHIVISPCELRPPERFFGSTSDFSGVCFVNSLLSSMVMKRRDAVYGLKLFSAIVVTLGTLQVLRVFDHFLVCSEFHVCFLPIAPITLGSTAPA